MVERLQSSGVIRTPAVATALETVPRHRFIDGASVETAYADEAVVTKTDPNGTAMSSASQPTIVAAMLEMSELQAGHRVMEIGTGTGYNAALLATLVGPTGLVVSIELEDDLATAARRRLTDEGFGSVNVITGDGNDGEPSLAPYDRVVVTTGAPAVAEAWTEQLRDGGRLVVPVVGADGIGAISCLVKRGPGLDELATLPCGFLPMRFR